MAYNKNEFVLKEGTLQYGSWTNPHLIVPGTNPSASFVATDNLGYNRMGTFKLMITDTFVEYKAQTPHKIIRKDLLERIYKWQFTANQFNAGTMGLMFNMDVDTGVYTLMWIGNDAPVKFRYGYLLSGTKVDGTPFKAAIWDGEIVTEDKSINLIGTDYVDIPIEIQAFEGDTFLSNPNDEHNYGMIFQQESS